MTFDEKIRFLQSYARCRENLEVYHEQITNLELSMLPQGMKISDMPRRGGSDDPLADFGARFYEIDQRIIKAEKRMLSVVATINQIAESDPVGHKILTMRYVQGCRAKQIERACRVSDKTRKKYHDRAVEMLKP